MLSLLKVLIGAGPDSAVDHKCYNEGANMPQTDQENVFEWQNKEEVDL